MGIGKTDAQSVDFGEITVGREISRSYVLTEEVYRAYLAAFDDRSPLHVDDEWARSHGFARKVMHGGILNGFVSHFVGMVFPGRPSLLLGVDLRYANPVYLGEELRLEARVAQIVDSQRVIVLELRFQNVSRGGLAASGKAQIKHQEGA